MSRRSAVLAFLLLAGLSPIGCARIPTQPPAVVKEVVTVEQSIPAGLLTCDAEPDPPAADSDEPTFWEWVRQMMDAGRDCRFKLSQVKRLSR